MLKKIRSGVQTGADQGGLEAGVELGLEVEGLIPHGWRTDDGPLPEMLRKRWNVKEHWSSAYPPRTEQNIKLSDGTVIFGDSTSPGSTLTLNLCDKHHKPCIINPTPEKLKYWVDNEKIEVLNVAGNRERKSPGIFNGVQEIIIKAFKAA